MLQDEQDEDEQDEAAAVHDALLTFLEVEWQIWCSDDQPAFTCE